MDRSRRQAGHLRVEDSREDPGVLEEVVSCWWLNGAVCQVAFRSEPRDEILGVNNRGGGEAGARNHLASSVAVQQHLDDTARFRTQTGKFIFRQQPLRADPGQHH